MFIISLLFVGSTVRINELTTLFWQSILVQKRLLDLNFYGLEPDDTGKKQNVKKNRPCRDAINKK